MFIVVRLLGFLFVTLTIGAAIATFCAGVTNDWIVMDAKSESNQTISFGMTSFCVGGDCRSHNYVAPLGCKRTKWEVQSRLRAVEAFVLLHMVLSLIGGLASVFTVLAISTNAHYRDRCREQGIHVLTATLEGLKASEVWAKRRLVGGVIAVGVALLCLILSIALFASVNSSFVYCESVCSYFAKQLGTGSCATGGTFAMAIAGLVLTVLALLVGVALLLTYLKLYPLLFSGIMTRDEPFRPVVPRRVVPQGQRMDGVFDPEDTLRGEEWGSGKPAQEWSVASSGSQRLPGATQHRNSRQEAQDALRWLQDPTASAATGPAQKEMQSSVRSESSVPPLAAPKTTPQRQATPPVRQTPKRQRQVSPTNSEQRTQTTRTQQPNSSSSVNKAEPSPSPGREGASEGIEPSSHRDDRAAKARNPLENVDVSSDEPARDRHILQEHIELIANLEGDDWEYVQSSQLYWSGKERLYFDPGSLNFYDPETDQWYDPDTGEWYALVDQG